MNKELVVSGKGLVVSITKKQSVFQKLASFVEKFKGVGGQL